MTRKENGAKKEKKPLSLMNIDTEVLSKTFVNLMK